MEQHDIDIVYQQLVITIGKTIRSLRLAKNWSQEDLAYTADIDRTYIGYIENGKQNISLKKLIQICAALEISLVTLITTEHE